MVVVAALKAAAATASVLDVSVTLGGDLGGVPGKETPSQLVTWRLRPALQRERVARHYSSS